MDNNDGLIGKSVRGYIWDPVWYSIKGSTVTFVFDHVSESIGNPVHNSVWDSAWGSVYELVGDSTKNFSNTRFERVYG